MSRIAGVASAFCLCVCVLAGCANRLRELEGVEEETHAELLSARVALEGVESPLRGARPVLELVRIESIEDRTERRVVRQEEVTPYAGWRELYEVPAGAICVPLSLAFNALNAVLVGYVPDDQVRAFTSWTYAALNPALNAENAGRVERRRGEVISRSTEQTLREQRLPLAGAAVSARLDDGPAAALRADARGNLALHLLELSDPGHELRPRRLIVQVEAEEVVEFPIERDLAHRLRQARAAIGALQAKPGDPRSLARAVFQLDRLGFEEYSLGVEDEIAVQLHREPSRLAEFSRELDRLYGTPPADLPPVGLESQP